METNSMQQQINALDQKLDLVLEYITTQQQKREALDDLMDDLSIVARDAFSNSVVMLDKAQVELDNCGISCLIIKILQNLQTFHEMLEMMESARDFMKDLSPVLHQIGLDAVHKMNELDQKGYFEYLRETGRLADTWVASFPASDMAKLRENIPLLASTLRNLTDPALLQGLNRIVAAMQEVKMDEKTDHRSWWSLIKEMNSKEFRKTLSYSLRLIKTINNS